MPLKSIQIVQFTHPGGEYQLTRKEMASSMKEWNYGKHQRKFMKATGRIADDNGLLSCPQKLQFWGEWEPESVITVLPSSSLLGMPQYLHEPVLEIDVKKAVVKAPAFNARKELRQNTDPFIFRDTFLYSCCKQRRKEKGKPTTVFSKMATLDRGSIILFGSTLIDASGLPFFALDTVFVVSDCIEYYPKLFTSTLGSRVSDPWYEQIMGYSHWSSRDPFICYIGATPNQPVNGMFSFSPCQPCDNTSVGFPRVPLRNSDLSFVTNNLNSSPKYKDSSLAQNKQYWDKICNIVKFHGYEKGVGFEYRLVP